MKFTLFLLAASLAGVAAGKAADSQIAAGAINALGVDLYRLQAGGEDNVLLSPYSIQNALAMTFAGADGKTRAEMQHVLHYPTDEKGLDGSFGFLEKELDDDVARAIEEVKGALEFNLANRLYGQKDYDFRPAFLNLVKDKYGAPLALVDYRTAPEKIRVEINAWVARQTKDRIRDLIPANGIQKSTRLTLVNALYLRALWSTPFNDKLTKPEHFFIHGRDAADVPMMQSKSHCGYVQREGFQIVTRDYFSGALQFVILLPDKPDGLAALEKEVTPKMLGDCAHLPSPEIILHLPKFRLEPPTMALGGDLKKLGMKTAFDDPPGSANFERMAPRKPNDYLAISAVFHKTYLAFDETGTEAAAATAVTMRAAALMAPLSKPVEVMVDHPFLFAIQHVPSGACLFLGRVTDPR